MFGHTLVTLSLSTDMLSQVKEDITHGGCHCHYPNLLLVGDYQQRERGRERERERERKERGGEVSPCLARD